MVRIIIASLVGGIILFMWNFLSWVILPLHDTSFKYTPKQDSLLAAISAALPEDGNYALPYADPSQPDFKEKTEVIRQSGIGKPAARIIYWKQMPPMTAGTFIFGFLYYFFAAFLVCIILVAARDRVPSFFQRWWLVMLIPMIIVLESTMSNHNWMNHPWHYLSGEVVDRFVSWGVCGAWLSWIVGKK